MLITIPKRRPKRLRTFLDGSLDTEKGPQEVRVRDISQEGALIETLNPPGTGEKITLLCSGHRLEGIVVWQKDSRSGIEFEHPLHSRIWNDLSCQPMRVGAPRNYRRDRIADDDVQIEVTPRTIRLKGRGLTD